MVSDSVVKKNIEHPRHDHMVVVLLDNKHFYLWFYLYEEKLAHRHTPLIIQVLQKNEKKKNIVGGEASEAAEEYPKRLQKFHTGFQETE